MPVGDPPTGPFVASIPSALQHHINTLQGGYANCGRLSSSLVRLDSVQQRLADSLQRHVSSLEAELSVLRQDVEEDQLRLKTGLHQLQEHFERLQADFGHFQGRTMERLSRVATKLSKAQSEDFVTIVNQMQACTTDFERDVRTAETDLTRVESQLVGLNAWNVAWPEAITAFQTVQSSSSSPPQYSLPRPVRTNPSTGVATEPAVS
ncbi:hypothetical protein CF319_g4573 [Tilletia indica]|nr:hypothetical protein CF319_g4573 [Tilletia indica]